MGYHTPLFLYYDVVMMRSIIYLIRIHFHAIGLLNQSIGATDITTHMMVIRPKAVLLVSEFVSQSFLVSW